MRDNAKVHDSIFRMLLEHREMVRDLAESCFSTSWRNAVRWEAAETVSARSVLRSDLSQRENDVVWKLPCKDGVDVYLYLMIELQARPDPQMLRRMYEYSYLFDQVQWDKRQVGAGTAQLPRMVPLVLYTGDKKWEAPTDLDEEREPWASGLDESVRLGIQFRYALVGAHHTPEARGREPNVVDCWLQALRAQQGAESDRCVRALRRAADRCGNVDVPEILLMWLILIFGKEKLPHASDEQLRELWKTPRRAEPMLENLEERWMAQGHAKGRTQGRTEGRTEGRAEGHAEGMREGLMQLIAVRFGREQAEAFAPRIEGLTSKTALDALFHHAAVDPTTEGLLDRLDHFDRERMA